MISGNFLRVSRYQSGNSPVGPVLLELLWKLTGTFAQLCTGPRQVLHVRAAAGEGSSLLKAAARCTATDAAMRAARRASLRLILLFRGCMIGGGWLAPRDRRRRGRDNVNSGSGRK